MRFLACLAATSLLATSAAAETAPKPTQYVIVSFDGAHDNKLWERSLALGERTGAKFTYFLSCTFLMSQAQRHAYQAPHQKKARSNTGFAQSSEEVRIRLDHIWKARLAGHEMASHVCGHFDGGDWSEADWEKEFRTFDETLLSAWKENGVGDKEPEGWADFVRNDIKGFRAPYLSAGKGLWPALRSHGFAYDASSVSKGPVEPEDAGGILRYALPRIEEGPQGKRVIAMDYNLYARHSKAREMPEKAAEFEARTLAAFRKAFDEQYQCSRVPLQLGFHFVEMNKGAYWSALEKFLDETCGKPEVACVSYAGHAAAMAGQGSQSSF